MDSHVRDELAQTVRKARRSIQGQQEALTGSALGSLITFGQDWEAMQRETTAWTKVQGWRIRNHLINAYLRKAWQWHCHRIPVMPWMGTAPYGVAYITQEDQTWHDADC